MAQGQDQGGGGDGGDVSYENRGADRPEDLTQYDENMMDRAAQAGTTGAFGAGGDQASTTESRREDVEAAFGGEAEPGGGQSGGGGGETTGS